MKLNMQMCPFQSCQEKAVGGGQMKQLVLRHNISLLE